MSACRAVLDSYGISNKILEIRVLSRKINSVPRYISNDKWYIHQQIHNSMFPQHLISAGGVQSANLQRNKKSVEDDINAIN